MIPKGNSDPIVEAFLEDPYNPKNNPKNRINLGIKSNIHPRSKYIDNRMFEEPNQNER